MIAVPPVKLIATVLKPHCCHTQSSGTELRIPHSLVVNDITSGRTLTSARTFLLRPRTVDKRRRTLPAKQCRIASEHTSASEALQVHSEGMPPEEELQGTLFRYGFNSAQVAFATGEFPRHVVFVGGLGDGLLPTKYIEPLASALLREKWSLVQPLLSSSYSGWGTASLDQDAAELEELLEHLVGVRRSEGVVLIGHSTGCQDIVHLMRRGGPGTRAVTAVILQAPISDREIMAGQSQTAGMRQLAERMIAEGRGQELMPRAAESVPVTAYRYQSLAGINGDDDLFSSDYSAHELEAKLGHMSSVRCMVLFSGEDEYVPTHVDKAALLHRLGTAMGGAMEVLAPGADHSLSNYVTDAVAAMIGFIKGEQNLG